MATETGSFQVQVNISESFRYPAIGQEDGRRMCAAGQRRAVAEAWNVLAPDGGETGRQKTLARAATASIRLAHGADVNKHDLISLVVVELFDSGRLQDYVDRIGNYRLETNDGRSFPRNLFDDANAGKTIF